MARTISSSPPRARASGPRPHLGSHYFPNHLKLASPRSGLRPSAASRLALLSKPSQARLPALGPPALGRVSARTTFQTISSSPPRARASGPRPRLGSHYFPNHFKLASPRSGLRPSAASRLALLSKPFQA